MNIRIRYFTVFITLFLVELFLALYVHDDFFRPYIGDMLVVIVLYTFIRIFFPYGFKYLSLYVFIFAVFVELLQFINIIELLNIKNNVLAISIGSVFDIKDIICYGLGCIILYFYEFKFLKKN